MGPGDVPGQVPSFFEREEGRAPARAARAALPTAPEGTRSSEGEGAEGPVSTSMRERCRERECMGVPSVQLGAPCSSNAELHWGAGVFSRSGNTEALEGPGGVGRGCSLSEGERKSAGDEAIGSLPAGWGGVGVGNSRPEIRTRSRTSR